MANRIRRPVELVAYDNETGLPLARCLVYTGSAWHARRVPAWFARAYGTGFSLHAMVNRGPTARRIVSDRGRYYMRVDVVVP